MLSRKAQLFKNSTDWKAAVIFLIAAVGAVYWSPCLISLQIPEKRDFFDFLTSKKMVFVAALLLVAYFAWVTTNLVDIRLPGRLRRKPLGFFAAVLLVFLLTTLFGIPKARWLFLEAAKVRATRFSLQRSYAFWQRDSMDFVPGNKTSILLVGSSQMNFAVDDEYLASLLSDSQVVKKSLPGFSIMQYDAITDEILHLKPSIVACWLSEFDTFRDQRIPANRLRYFADFPYAIRMIKALGPYHSWKNRTELADIFLGSMLPFWRERDLWRNFLFLFWWDASAGEKNSNDRQFDQNIGIMNARVNMARQIKETELVDANFKIFEMFAEALRNYHVRLYVFEGQSNPLVTDVYPIRYRRETRQRFVEMARRQGFQYITQDEIPRYGPEDFVDGYHLDQEASRSFTRFLAATVSN